MEEELLGRIDRLLEHFQRLIDLLDTIASYIKPPLPLPIMAAGVLFAIYGRIPARLAAAWGYVVRWAKSALEPAHAPAQRGIFVCRLARSVMWAEFILSPFKIEDAHAFQIRAEIAEAGRDEAKQQQRLAETLRVIANNESDASRQMFHDAQAERDKAWVDRDKAWVERDEARIDRAEARIDRDEARADYNSLKNRCDAFLGRVSNQMQ
jgi:hypothetical protein